MSLHRERVRAFFARGHADRVAIDYDANPGIDLRLKQSLGLAPDDHEGLRVALDTDFRGVGPGYRGPPVHAQLPDRRVGMFGERTRWIEHGSGGYWDYCDFPLRDATVDDIERWPMPDPDLYDYSRIDDGIARHAGYGLIYGDPGLGDLMNSCGTIRSAEQVLLDLGERNPALLRLMQRRSAIQLEVMARCLERGKGRIDGIWMGEDLGSQIAPLISLKTYREILAPIHRRFIDLAKSFGLPVMIHCCGSSSWAFNDFAAMGISAVDTLQPEARKMEPVYLKQTYGDRLAFRGGFSTAGAVEHGTVAEAVADARRTLEAYMPGGGYAFAPTHAFQDDTPAENVLAAYALAREHGRYRAAA